MERNEKQLNEGEAAQIDTSQGSSTLEHFFQETPITLADIRSTLIRLEETIIFALIERAQFRANPAVYRKDEETEVRQKGKSFLDVFFGQIEKAHSLMRRYTSPDEHPFYPEELERPILPLLNYSAIIRPNNINLNPKIMRLYLERIVPVICEAGNDNREYGSSANADINALQAISKRIHYGKFVAEIKFQQEKEKYSTLIREKDTDGIMNLLTHPEVEKKVLARVRAKSSAYGRDISEETTSADASADRYKVDPDAIMGIYRDYVIPLTKEVEVDYLLQRLSPVSVAFLGPKASYSHQAAVKYFKEGTPELLECATFSEVFQSVLSNKTSFGIVPIENSTTGRVHQALANFFDTSAKVCGETYLKVSHAFLLHEKALAAYEAAERDGKGAQKVGRLYSHPQVFDQSRKWIEETFPGATCVSVSSSSQAAKLVSEEAGEETDGKVSGALGSSLLAGEYGLKIVRKDIQDDPNNTTRFLVIAKTFTGPSGKDKTLLTFGLKHMVGSLSSALTIFSKHGINMSGIESYPNKAEIWSYNFLVELEGHVEDKNVKEALEELRELATFINIIGSFPEAYP
jgi:chorismate mutase